MKNFRRIMQLAAIAFAVNANAADIKEIRFGVEPGYAPFEVKAADGRSEEHTSELQSQR